jgi:hypothetical protein
MVEIDGVYYDVPTTQLGIGIDHGTHYTVRRLGESEAMISPSPVPTETTVGELVLSGWRLKNHRPGGSMWVYPSGRAVATNGTLDIDRIGRAVPSAAREHQSRRRAPYVRSDAPRAAVGVSQTLVSGQTGGTVAFNAPTTQAGVVISDGGVEESDTMTMDTHQAVHRKAFPTETDPLHAAVIRPPVSFTKRRSRRLVVDGIDFRSSDGGFVELSGSRVVAISGELVIQNP